MGRRAGAWLQAVRDWLPEGRALPDEAWLPRHRVLLTILWAHVPGVFLFGLFRNEDPSHLVVEACAVAFPAVLATAKGTTRRFRSGACVIGLLMASGVLTHLSGGTIEMHFHFFVMVSAITVYQDWFPFLLAIGFVVVHHGLMGVVDTESVYNHVAARNNPWKWAAIHGFFILGASAANLANWRLNENSHRRAEELAVRLHEGDLRRRQALQINDNVVQGLAVAKYALDSNAPDVAKESIERTLDSARGIISDLMQAVGDQSAIVPGDLVRDEPVGVIGGTR